MCDRNVKSEYILIKLCALVFEYICEKKLPNFMRKYYLIAELLIYSNTMTKYLGFQYSCLLQSLVTSKQLA